MNTILVLSTHPSQYVPYFNHVACRCPVTAGLMLSVYHPDLVRGHAYCDLIILEGALDAVDSFGRPEFTLASLLEVVYPALNVDGQAVLLKAIKERYFMPTGNEYTVDFSSYKIFEDRASVLLPENILLKVNRNGDCFYYSVMDTECGEELDKDCFSCSDLEDLGIDPFSVCVAEVLAETILETMEAAHLEEELLAYLLTLQEEMEEAEAEEAAAIAKQVEFEDKVDGWLAHVREMLVDDDCEYRMSYRNDVDGSGNAAILIGVSEDMDKVYGSDMMHSFSHPRS
jgi:hypothetical protein